MILHLKPIIMTLAEIKSKLNIPTLELNTAKDAAGDPTEWMRHWNNDTREAVSIHKDLVADIKANPGLSSLGLQTETRTGEKGDYTAYRVVKFKTAEVTI